MSHKTKMASIKEWRDLGFYYEYIDKEKCWIILGSKIGISNLYHILEQYCQKPKNAKMGEHDHLGPYMYLKIATWSEPIINSDGIYGSLEDLGRLADSIKTVLDKAKPSDKIEIDKEYSPFNESHIRIIIREDEFDPVSPDSQLFEN